MNGKEHHYTQIWGLTDQEIEEILRGERMREITTHHDGHGLAESIKLVADDIPADPTRGGASHFYEATIKHERGTDYVLKVQFQKGPRNQPDSIPGVIDNVLLAIVRDRLECFQRGAFPSEEGQDALELIECAMACFKRRADLRAARGVLGKAER